MAGGGISGPFIRKMPPAHGQRQTCSASGWLEVPLRLWTAVDIVGARQASAPTERRRGTGFDPARLKDVGGSRQFRGANADRETFRLQRRSESVRKKSPVRLGNSTLSCLRPSA